MRSSRVRDGGATTPRRDRWARGCFSASVAVALLAAASCSDEPECKKAAECPTVVCPDGVKHQECNGGTCFRADDCGPDKTGGW